MKAFTVLVLMLCFSCSKQASISKDAVGIIISPIKMDISHLNEIDWSIGMKKEAKVSQSFTFIVDMPSIKQEDLEYLTEQRGIDSWILRLIVIKGSDKQDLGSLYAMFRPKKVARSSQSSKATSSVTLKVYYAAAYASERFRAFKCPAFSHNKKITKMGIEGTNKDFSLTIGQTVPYNERSHLVELAPSSFNGGHSLVGEYYLEIAAYDSRKKIIHSEFKRIPMHVSVKEEKMIRVQSCDGIHPEIE
jgi:hypothetical protein